MNATDNIGVGLENLVFIELRRRGCDVFYHSDKKECDFVVRQGTRTVGAYQVTRSMADPKTRTKEISGIKEAMEAFGLSSGYIITMDEKETIDTTIGIIHVLPAWEWLLR